MSGSGIVVFDFSSWAARYPELASPSTGVGSGLADLYFLEAQLYLDNSLASPVPDVTIRGLLLNMLTAHIAALNAPLSGQPASTLVGRISNASEGSVSVATEMNLPGSAAWFAQTKYGVAFWQATANLRTARYIPGAGVRPRQGAYGPFSGPFGYRGGW